MEEVRLTWVLAMWGTGVGPWQLMDAGGTDPGNGVREVEGCEVQG